MSKADLRSGRGHTVPLSPSVDARRLSRLRRAHSAFRGPPVRTRAHSAFSRLRRAHSAFRAYGVPYKRKLQGICLPLHTGKALQKQANRFTKARKEEIHRSHTTSGKQQRKTQKDPALGIPGVGSLLFIREKPSPLFSISQWLPCSASRDVQRLSRTRGVFRAYGGNHGGKPQLWRVPLRKGNPTEAISQSSRHNA